MASMYEEGVVSVWFRCDPWSDTTEVDALEVLCGVEYYDIDRNEANASDDGTPVDIAELLRPCSFSGSFMDAAIAKAHELGVHKAVWLLLQFDFAYDVAKTVRPISDELTFIGYFPYSLADLEKDDYYKV